MPTDYKRPDVPYEGESLPNNKRYELLTQSKRPPTAEMLDGEMNYVVDSMNDLDGKINAVQAGAIPGSREPLNADKVLKTDGAGNLSWIEVTDEQIQDTAVITSKIAPGAITTDKLGNASVTTNKIYDQNVTNEKLIDGAVTNNKIKDATIDGGTKIKTASIIPSKITSSVPSSYGVLLFHASVGHFLQGTTAPGYFLRTEGISGLTRYGRIKTADLDAQTVGTVAIANGSVTMDKLKVEAVTGDKVKNYTLGFNKIGTTGSTRGVLLTNTAGVTNPYTSPNQNGYVLKSVKDEIPQWKKLEEADLPLSTSPVYINRFDYAGASIVNKNPFGYVTNFSRPSTAYYDITFHPDYPAANFVAQVVISNPSSINAYFTVQYLNATTIRLISHHSSGTTPSGGTVILYRMA